jgi:hypothetical protein
MKAPEAADSPPEFEAMVADDSQAQQTWLRSMRGSRNSTREAREEVAILHGH